MTTRDVCSIRHPLAPPVGVPRDLLNTKVQDPDLAALAASPAIKARLDRDTMPIPAPQDREGYFEDRHFEYWLSGLSDYLKVKEVCDTDWAAASLLDFGGATGRVTRHFYSQDDVPEIMLCDININNVDWVLEHLPSDLAVFKNSATPSLPIPDDYLDVVTAFSVFTHIDEHELGWLHELRRVLKPNGILYATVDNDDTWRILPSTWLFNTLTQSDAFRAAYHPSLDLTDRLVVEYSSGSACNCNIFHPNSYLHRVWGSVFDVVDIRPLYHSYQSGVVLRKAPRRRRSLVHQADSHHGDATA